MVFRIVLVLILIGVARIAFTYVVLSHTMDEPSFISCGLEWLTQHTYTYMPEQPPLSHIPAAAGAWLAGAHAISKAAFDASRSPYVLYDSPSYYRPLAFARAGELPFFILAALVVWLWARRLHGNLAGLAAVLLFTTLPPVLAHAGLATTDMALCATVPASLYAFVLWLDNDGTKQSILLGLCMAAGILSKFSFLVFFPLGCVAVLLLNRGQYAHFRYSRSLALASAICAFVVWAGNWFSFTPVIRGIQDVREHNYYGHLSYLLGDRATGGWWYFFPVVLAYKTPRAFFILIALACIWLRRAPRACWIPMACAGVILLAALPSRIDIGVRHILPMYPLLAIPAGLAAARLIESTARLPRIVGGFLVLWQVAVSMNAHPDYIAYFNELAGGRPELVRVDSDLDWGQNFDRLARRLRDRGIDEAIGIAMFGCTDLTRHGLTNVYSASPWQPSPGWLAISATERFLCDEKPPADTPNLQPWKWLDGYEPVERISNGAVLLYHIPK